MNKRKLLVSALVISLAVVAIYFFWKTEFTLTLLLLLLALIKSNSSPIKREVLMFIIGGVVGTGAESVVMFGGSWAYAAPALINFPVWLPFLWGLAAITGITLYQGVSENENH